MKTYTPLIGWKWQTGFLARRMFFFNFVVLLFINGWIITICGIISEEHEGRRQSFRPHRLRLVKRPHTAQDRQRLPRQLLGHGLHRCSRTSQVLTWSWWMYYLVEGSSFWSNSYVCRDSIVQLANKKESKRFLEGVNIKRSFFLKVPRPGGEPGIFWFFIYFLSLKQRLRPLGCCAPLLKIIWVTKCASRQMHFGPFSCVTTTGISNALLTCQHYLLDFVEFAFLQSEVVL